MLTFPKNNLVFQCFHKTSNPCYHIQSLGNMIDADLPKKLLSFQCFHQTSNAYYHIQYLIILVTTILESPVGGYLSHDDKFISCHVHQATQFWKKESSQMILWSMRHPMLALSSPLKMTSTKICFSYGSCYRLI